MKNNLADENSKLAKEGNVLRVMIMSGRQLFLLDKMGWGAQFVLIKKLPSPIV